MRTIIRTISTSLFISLLFACAHSKPGDVARFETKESFVKSEGGTKLKANVYGVNGAKTLILVHGGPGLPGYMRPLGDLLLEKYRIVEYLQRDASESQSNGPFTIEAKVEDLKNVVIRSTEGNNKPIVIAHSGGSATALEFAKLYSDMIAKLILVGPAPLDRATDKEYDQNLKVVLSKLIPKWDRKVEDARWRYRKAKDPNEKHMRYHDILNLYWPAYFPDRKRPDNLQFGRANPDAMKESEADFREKMRYGTFKQNLSAITVPVVHIHGGYDPIPWRSTSETLKAAIPNYKFKLMKDAGHFPWLDRYAANDFINLLMDYIDR